MDRFARNCSKSDSKFYEEVLALGAHGVVEEVGVG